MDPSRASMTALIATFFRAYHYSHASPKIFEDSLAAALLTPQERETIEGVLVDSVAKFHPDLVQTDSDRATAIGQAISVSASVPVVLTRARYTEDKLTEAMQKGIGQYVIIGAGLDTFAFRRPDLRKRLQVLEIDHPATQAFKQSRLREAGVSPPPNLHFVPADLEQESVGEVLSRLPYDSTLPAFFSWLGVIMYLTRDAIMETLRSVRRIAAEGSQLVFDYLDQAVFVSENQSPKIRRTLETARRQGEPMISGFDPSTLGAEMATLGFRLLEDLSPEDLEERFFSNRTDGLHASEFVHIAYADVS